ncbi:MAG: Spy/CpxP family protein refolding chaperone [Planctomycetota bacterium]
MISNKISLMIISTMVFAGSFAGTVATRSGTTKPAPSKDLSPLSRWLALDGDQAAKIEALDPNFAEEIGQLRDHLSDARKNLIALFENSQTTDQQLRDQIEQVIEAHNRVERRVTDHLIVVRPQLTPAQQQRLFSLCAENVRYCWRQQRWRQGRGCQGDETSNGGDHGFGQGKGPGRGHGRGHGAGRGPGRGHGGPQPDSPEQ